MKERKLRRSDNDRRVEDEGKGRRDWRREVRDKCELRAVKVQNWL